MPDHKRHGVAVQTDDEGFLLNGTQWTPQIAEAFAKKEGISPLTDKHWKVIALCREDAARRGHPPGAGRISKLSGIGMDELERLFAGDPKEIIARIAGLPRPRTAVTDGGETEEKKS